MQASGSTMTPVDTIGSEFPSTDQNWDYKDTWSEVSDINNLTPSKENYISWKILHGFVDTDNKLKAMKLSDGLCKVCTRG